MKKLVPYLILLFLCLFLEGQTTTAQVVNSDDAVGVDVPILQWKEGEVIIKFKDSSNANIMHNANGRFMSATKSAVQSVFDKLGATDVDQLMPLSGDKVEPTGRRAVSSERIVKDEDLSQIYLLHYTNDISVEDAVKELNALDEIEYAEPNYICTMFGDESENTDPLYDQQYGIPAINLDKLWDLEKTETERPVIAILDTGCDITHPDLADNIWTNESEADGTAKVDDDANGFSDDIHGWNFLNNDADLGDPNGHGTHCAGIAGAVGNNGIGITGANPDAYIMPIKVLSANGSGDMATIIRGVDYAIANGANVISMSLGWNLANTSSSSLESSMSKAYAKGLAIVAAAGNNGYDFHDIDINFKPICQIYPAAYDDVIGVMASNQSNGTASFTNTDGDRKEYEVMAPGVSVLSTFPGGSYKTYSGTSMATPLVAGALSRLLQIKGYDYALDYGLIQDLSVARMNDTDVVDMYAVSQYTEDNRELNIAVSGETETVDEGTFLYPVLTSVRGHIKPEQTIKAIGVEPKVDEDDMEENMFKAPDMTMPSSYYDIDVDEVAFGQSVNTSGTAKGVSPFKIVMHNDAPNGRNVRVRLETEASGVVCSDTIEVGTYYKGAEIKKDNLLPSTIEKDTVLVAGNYYAEKCVIYPGVNVMLSEGTAVNIDLVYNDGLIKMVKGSSYNGIYSEGDMSLCQDTIMTSVPAGSTLTGDWYVRGDVKGTAENPIIYNGGTLTVCLDANILKDRDLLFQNVICEGNLVLRDFAVSDIVVNGNATLYGKGLKIFRKNASYGDVNGIIEGTTNNVSIYYQWGTKTVCGIYLSGTPFNPSNLIVNGDLTFKGKWGHVKNVNANNCYVYTDTVTVMDNLTTLTSGILKVGDNGLVETLTNSNIGSLYSGDYFDDYYTTTGDILNINNVNVYDKCELKGTVVSIDSLHAYNDAILPIYLSDTNNGTYTISNSIFDQETSFFADIDESLDEGYVCGWFDGDYCFFKILDISESFLSGYDHEISYEDMKYVSPPAFDKCIIPKLDGYPSLENELIVYNINYWCCSDGSSDHYVFTDADINSYTSFYLPITIIVKNSNLESPQLGCVRYSNCNLKRYSHYISYCESTTENNGFGETKVTKNYADPYTEPQASDFYHMWYGCNTLEYFKKNLLTVTGWRTADDLDYSNILWKPLDTCPGFVWKVLVDGYDAHDQFDDAPALGVGTHKVDVYFNKPMDTTVAPAVSMGLSSPYTQKSISDDGSWNAEGDIYTAYITIGGKTNTDGVNYIRVADAKDPDGLVILTDDVRNRVNVQVAGAMSTGLIATAGIGSVKLEWQTDEADFADLMGYNVYRVEEGATDTLMVNSKLISADATEYTDYDVTPGTTYYYMVREMGTDFQEFDVSNMVACVPLTAELGDANGSLKVDVLDIVTEIAYMTGENPQPFIFEAADVKTDSKINILDVVGTANIIKSAASGAKATASAVDDEDIALYSIEDGVLYINCDKPIAGIQLTLDTNNASELTSLEGVNGMEHVAKSVDEEQSMYIAFSMNDVVIPIGKQAILNVGEAGINDIVLSSVEGNDILAVESSASGIDKVSYDGIEENVSVVTRIYDMTGRQVDAKSMTKGVYVINQVVDGKVVKSHKFLNK